MKQPQPNWEWVLENIKLGRFAFDTNKVPVFTSITSSLAQVMHNYMEQRPQIRFDRKLHDGIVGSEIQRIWFSLFKNQGAQVFKIAREFGEALLDAPVNIRANYIVFDNVIRCIEFPESIRISMNDGLHARCAYIVATDYMKFNEEHMPVAGHDHKNVPLDENGERRSPIRAINMIVPLYEGEEVSAHFERCAVNFFTDDETVETAIERARVNSSSPVGFSDDLWSYAMKSLLYIHSGDPDLREFRPQRMPASAKGQRRWRRENLAKIPMTLVGFDFKKPKIYSKDSTRVRFHSRWQPWGPKRSKVKLIWIDEHVRRLNKQIVETDTMDQDLPQG